MNPHNVPEPLRSLLPLAKRWDIGDDYERTRAVKAAGVVDLEFLITQIDAADDSALEQWLAGPEASSSSPTPEYPAFTSLLMAADQARLDLQRKLQKE